jgi:hypothetical protein
VKYAMKLRGQLRHCCGYCDRRFPADRLNTVPHHRKLVCDICIEERDETAIARPATLRCPSD